MKFIVSERNDSTVYTDENQKYEFAIEKKLNENRIVTINESDIEELSKDEVYKLLSFIYYRAAKDGVKLKVETTKPLVMNQEQLGEILVKDIEPIKFDGEIDISDEMALYMCIEFPVRNACMMLNEMGINTLMSSANKTDVESRNQKIDAFQNRSGEHFNIGNGYAWIMIDWESLSQDNKQKFIMLNNAIIPIELSNMEKENLIHNCEVNNFDVSQKELVSFFQVISFSLLSTNNRSLFKLHVNSDEDAYYEQNRRGYACNNSLCNHGDNFRTVVIRYPLDENVTASQVNNYFMGIIKHLNVQKKQVVPSDSKK